MRTVTLKRGDSSPEGTPGIVTVDDGTVYHSIELQWRDNLPGKSCIPTGLYNVDWRFSPAHGNCYHVDGVEGRSDIEIHSANFAGDAYLGYECQLLGCIALGMGSGTMPNNRGVDQLAVTSSRAAMADFNERMGSLPFLLRIVG